MTIKMINSKIFKQCMILASADILLEEGYYKKPYKKMELHQRIRCKVDADRAMKMLNRAIDKYDNLKSKLKGDGK